MLETCWHGWCHLLPPRSCADGSFPVPLGRGCWTQHLGAWMGLHKRLVLPRCCPLPSVLPLTWCSGSASLDLTPPCPAACRWAHSLRPSCPAAARLPRLSFVTLFCRAPVPGGLHRFQEKLKKPGDTRCLPLCSDMTGLFILENCSWVQSVVKTDWTFCALLLLEFIAQSSLAISRWLPLVSDLLLFFWCT